MIEIKAISQGERTNVSVSIHGDYRAIFDESTSIVRALYDTIREKDKLFSLVFATHVINELKKEM